MLTLSPDDLINRGANRACYRHPDDPGRCVKLDLTPGLGTRRGMNALEFAFHTALARRLGAEFYRHAPRCYGFVETNLGMGLCFEIIRDADGQRSTRFNQYIAAHRCAPDHAQQLIDRLYVFIRDHAVQLFDVNLHNLLVRRDAEGREQLVVIDWKGPGALREFIPAARYIPLVARLKTARRFKRLRIQAQALALTTSTPCGG